ncbi:uncharacterized protein [Cherax quadricarinatus]|nr:uncharacterized protein LOC128700750 [Cherax quadricarinatus]
MRVLVAACVVCVVVCVAGQEQEPTQAQQEVAVPDAIRKLRQPFTELPLTELVSNLKNPATVKFYVECVIEAGTCDNIGKALQNLMRDQQRVSQLCYGCSQCEMEKLRYALDVLKNDYKELACQVQNFVQINGLFGSTNPCA